MVIKREDLYETLREQCPGKYSVGLHGIDTRRSKYFNDIDPNMSDDDLSNAVAKNITTEGLKVYSSRSINGTVKFCGRLDSKADLQKVYNDLVYYNYPSSKDYVIVAAPVEFTSESGNSLYVGATNLDSDYKRYFDTTGSEVSTIFDEVVLGRQARVDPKFILGRFRVLDDETIDLEINEKHISKNNGIMTDEEFNSYVRTLRINLAFSYPGLYDAIQQKDKDKLLEFMKGLENPSRYTVYLPETITQLLNEENIRDLSPQDQESIALLKQEHRRVLENNRRYEEEQMGYRESLKSLSLEQLQEFAVNNPYCFGDIPEETRNNVELMRQVTGVPGLKPILLCYMGDDVRNDPTSMINIVNNSIDAQFDYMKSFYQRDPDKSDLAYSVIGLDVRTDPLFWESLNTRILEINKESEYKMDYFDTNKEIRLATEEKAKSAQQTY